MHGVEKSTEVWVINIVVLLIIHASIINNMNTSINITPIIFIITSLTQLKMLHNCPWSLSSPSPLSSLFHPPLFSSSLLFVHPNRFRQMAAPILSSSPWGFLPVMGFSLIERSSSYWKKVCFDLVVHQWCWVESNWKQRWRLRFCEKNVSIEVRSVKQSLFL